MKSMSMRACLAPVRRMRGASTVKLLVLIPVALVLLLLLVVGFFEGRKAYWDSQVREMCEKDGGVKVFETFPITRSQYFAWGGQDGTRGIPVPHGPTIEQISRYFGALLMTYCVPEVRQFDVT